MMLGVTTSGFRRFASSHVAKRRLSSDNGASGAGGPTSESSQNPFTAFLIGSSAGGLGSIIGLGGSFVALPLLTGVMKMPQNAAHGTALATVLFTSLGGTMAYMLKPADEKEDGFSFWKFVKSVSEGEVPEKMGNVDPLVALCLSASSSVTVVLGAKISKRMTPQMLKLSMGVLLLVVTPLIPARDMIQDYIASRKPKEAQSVDVLDQPKPTLLGKALTPLGIGTFTGVLAGIFGVGGGVLQIPALCLLTNIDYHTALGTSLASMLPVALIGGFTHYRQKTLVPRVALPLGIGSLVGSYIGGSQANKIDAEQLKYAFPAIMMTLGANGIVQALRMMRR